MGLWCGLQCLLTKDVGWLAGAFIRPSLSGPGMNSLGTAAVPHATVRAAESRRAGGGAPRAVHEGASMARVR